MGDAANLEDDSYIPSAADIDWLLAEAKVEKSRWVEATAWLKPRLVELWRRKNSKKLFLPTDLLSKVERYTKKIDRLMNVPRAGKRTPIYWNLHQRARILQATECIRACIATMKRKEG